MRKGKTERNEFENALSEPKAPGNAFEKMDMHDNLKPKAP